MRTLVVLLVLGALAISPVLAPAACFRIDGTALTMRLDIATQVPNQYTYTLAGHMRHYCGAGLYSPMNGTVFRATETVLHFGVTVFGVSMPNCEPVILEGLLSTPSYESGNGWAWFARTGDRYAITFSPVACE